MHTYKQSQPDAESDLYPEEAKNALKIANS